jgi:hypothetical protein
LVQRWAQQEQKCLAWASYSSLMLQVPYQ